MKKSLILLFIISTFFPCIANATYHLNYFAVYNEMNYNGVTQVNRLAFDVVNVNNQFPLTDVLGSVVLTDPNGKNVTITIPVEFVSSLEENAYYNTNNGQWVYPPFYLYGWYGTVFSDQFITGTYHLTFTDKDGEISEKDFVFNNIVNLPIIPSSSFQYYRDHEGNFIGQWQVPYISPKIQSSVRAQIKVYDEQEKYLGEVLVTMPNNMGLVFVPKDIFDQALSMGKMLKLFVVTRTNDNNNRAYSTGVLLPDLIPQSTACTATVTEFSAGISANGRPFDITTGPDGNLWFTENPGDRIGRITPTGVITEFSTGITPNSGTRGITTGPDGNLWFAEVFGNRIGRITPSGVITEFSTGFSPNSGPWQITTGPDGNLWFTENTGNRIGRITPSGVITEFSTGITPNSGPATITAGPDGNLWFTEATGNRIGRITPNGVITEFSAGITANSGPAVITTGPDGNLWFTENNYFVNGTPGGNRIGRITPNGVITEFSAGITPNSVPMGIITGPDGNLWFTEAFGNRIGKITPSGVVSECSSGITANSGPGGITTGPDGNLWFTEVTGGRIGKLVGGTSACTATIDESLSLHIPVLSYLIPYWGAPSFWVDLVYDYNPTYPASILFKLTNAGIISIPTFSCVASTLSNDLKIHIPDILLPDGITHLWVDLEYSAGLSTEGNAWFVVTNYGVVSN